jgi:hypothetical protein
MEYQAQQQSPQKSSAMHGHLLTSPQKYLSLSPTRTLSTTDSSSLHPSVPIDPECLSPLPFSSSTRSSLIESQYSPQVLTTDSQRVNKGLNLGQKLKVKVSGLFHDKNENVYTPMDAEGVSGLSLSTSAVSSPYIESIQLKQEAGKKDAATIVIEKSDNNQEKDLNKPDNELLSNENGIQNINSSDSHNNNLPNVVAASQGNLDEDPLRSVNNLENNNQQAANEQEANYDLGGGSLEFVLERTPVFTIFMTLVSLALASGVAISILEETSSWNFLFIIAYVFLLYLLMDSTIKLLKSLRGNRPTFINLLCGDQFYNTLDVLSLLGTVILGDLRLSGKISSIMMCLSPFIFVFVLYCVYSRVPTKVKLYGIGKRLFYIAQLFPILYKLEYNLPLSWEQILCSGWIILGGVLLKLLESIYKIYSAFAGRNALSLISRSAKFISILGLLLIAVDIVILMMILLGICRALDGEEGNVNFLMTWLTLAEYLNAFLLVYGTITGADILEFVFGVIEHFGLREQVELEQVERNSKKLEITNKETQVLRVSPTYYKIVKETELLNSENSPSGATKEEIRIEENVDGNDSTKVQENGKEGPEDNICYICCGNDANGVIIDCGHGGICYECLIDYIDKKDECMECRGKIHSVLKIETEGNFGSIFKSHEMCKIVRSEGSN